MSAAPPLTPAKAPRRQSFVAGIFEMLARAYVALPLVALSLVLLGWSFLYRLPNAPVLVQARLSPGSSGPLVTVKSVAELESAARNAAAYLRRDASEIPLALSRLEQSARMLGFKVEVSMKSSLTNAGGFQELTIHPAVVRLEEDYSHDRPAFTRALEWVHQLSTLPGKVELESLSLLSKGDGLARAELKLHFWRITDERPSQ